MFIPVNLHSFLCVFLVYIVFLILLIKWLGKTTLPDLFGERRRQRSD